MAKKEAAEKEVQEPLTEEQRIAQLEKKVGSNKVFLLSIAIFLIIIISMICQPTSFQRWKGLI